MKFSKWLLCVLAACVIIAVVIGLIAVMPSVVTPRYHVSIKSRNMKELAVDSARETWDHDLCYG